MINIRGCASHNGEMVRFALLAVMVVSLLAGIILVSSCASAPSTQPSAPALLNPPVSTSAPTTATPPEAKQEFQDLSAKQAYELMEQNKGNTNFIILDVRTPQEFADGHLANAVNVDFNSASFSNEMGKLDREETYLVYCRAGIRSRGATEVMKKLDFQKVYQLAKGIVEWQSERLPISK